MGKELKNFGVTMGIAFLAITLIILIKHKNINLPAAGISLVFFIFAILAPAVLKPFYIIWMKFAYILSWVNTRIILTVIFYLVFTPIGLFMKLFRKDLLERKIEKQKNSYWQRKDNEEFRALNYERQF